jgi:hypothetical protein
VAARVSAGEALNTPPTNLIEMLATEIADEYKWPAGAAADLVHAYLKYLKAEPLAESKLRDRRLRYGVPVASLDDYFLLPKKGE